MPTPSKFVKDRREEILRAKRLGCSDRTSARAGGVSPKTLRDWLKKGQDSEVGAYHDFFEDFEAARATPAVRAMEIVNRSWDDKPELAWKYLQVREDGFAPPVPQVAAASGPTIINLSLADGRPAATTIEVGLGEQDATPVRALPDRGSAT